jgi:hypothetical protein
MIHSPQYGVDYDIGWIFFTDVRGVVSDGIGYFERWSRGRAVSGGTPETATETVALPIVTHTGVVVGDNLCIEAHWATGVAKAFLDQYPADEIMFRRPRGWTVTTGIHIAAAAAAKLGCKYNKPLIAAQLLANTFVGHFVNQLCRGWVNDKVSAWLDHKGEFICSELSAYALNEQPQYRGQGVLAQPLDTISPQMLFDDPTLWEAAI